MRSRLVYVFFAFLVCSLTSGCAVPLQSSGSGFLRKEFLDYRRMAVLPFDGDDSGEVADTCARSLQQRFPDLEIVRWKAILDRFPDLQGRPDQKTKADIGRTFHAGAVILGSVYYPSIVRWIVQVIIVDTETEQVLGRSYAEIGLMGAEGIKQGCDLAVQKLVFQP